MGARVGAGSGHRGNGEVLQESELMARPCPFCASDDTALVTDRVRFERTASVLRCGACTLVFLDQESFHFPKDFYEHQYHQTYLTHVDPEMLDPARHYEKMTVASRPWIDRVRQMLTGQETVLDVGCSTGHVLTGIRDRAARVYGQELSRTEIEYCRSVHGLDVSDKPLQERFEPKSFDYILMIFVLEHIGEPVEFLRSFKPFLKPGGKFVILVPNVQDPLVQFYEIPAFRQFYFCIEHLFYYSPRTIGDLFAKAGLGGSVETLQEYPITNHLNWGYRQKPSDTLASRRLVPDVPLRDEAQLPAWERFWRETNDAYRSFLAREGFGDRIWCQVGVER
jgi:SAM-dependent methyltransferase